MKLNKKAAGSMTSALTIVLAINLMLWFGQIAILEINPDASNFFNPEGTLIDKFDAGNYTLDDDTINQLPSGESSVSVTTGNIFTDAWTGIKNWFLDSTGISYLLNVLSAPMSFLKAIGLPPEFSFGLGAMWYIICFLLLIGFIRGDRG